MLVCEQHPWRQFESAVCRREGCAGPGAPASYAVGVLSEAVDVLRTLAGQGSFQAQAFCGWFDVPVPDPVPAGWDLQTGQF